MSILKRMDQFFYLFLALGVICGFVFPSFLMNFNGYVIYLVMIIICVLFLKVDILNVVTHIRRPWVVLYISFIHLIATPLIAYFVFQFINKDFAMAACLLGAMPAGVTSALYTDIMKGRTPLALSIIIFTNLLSTLTIPLVLFFVFKTELDLNYLELFLGLLKVFLIPFLVAKTLKHVVLKKVAHRLQDYYNGIILCLLSLMMMIVIAEESNYILSHLNDLVMPMIYLFVAFFLFQVIGYVSVLWLGKNRGRIAISNTNMIVNNILGVVLAMSFFSSEIVTIFVLAFIPRSIMIVATHYYQRFIPR